MGPTACAKGTSCPPSLLPLPLHPLPPPPPSTLPIQLRQCACRRRLSPRCSWTTSPPPSAPPHPTHSHPAAAVRLSATGVPKVLLDDRRAFAYDGRMRCWMQITYDELRGSVHCASAGMPIRPLANGERALERGVGDRGGEEGDESRGSVHCVSAGMLIRPLGK